jgi:outer membrane receptor protein involved in Fe transport
MIAKADLFNVKNKFLFGYVRNNYEQHYNANVTNTTPLYFQVPGFNYPTEQTGPGTLPSNRLDWNVPVNQVIKDRFGNIKTAQQVYSQYDPGTEIAPPVDKVMGLIDRNLLDGYAPEQYAYYVNWQASLLKDRLNVLAGYRQEHSRDTGQHLIANYPWFIPPPEAYLNVARYPENVYNYSGNYAKTNFESNKGDSWMAGVSYAITPEINIYASVSKTFKFNTGNVGGFFPGDEVAIIQSALNHGGGSFQYLGQTITSVAQGQEALQKRGAYDDIQNETGMNYEIGVKTQLFDNKIVGTVSLFRGERSDQKLDDASKQSNAEEPFNSSTTLFDQGTVGYNTRNFRWRTTQLTNRIEGAEASVIYSPTRNFQSIISASWLWTARTVSDKTRPAPGSAAYNALTAAAKINSDIYYNARIENVPEYQFNAITKYTFADNLIGSYGRGLSLGFGVRYTSESVISRAVDFNPLRNGLQAGNYVVFDATISYPWELLGYQVYSSFGVYNLTDKEYLEGTYVESPARNWLLSTTLRF